MAELKRTLGFWMTSAFVFLNLVNTGIFFGVQLGASIAGVDSIIAWTLLALMSIYTGMCFSELTTMFPSAGGVYEFAKQAYGRFTSFEVGWIIWMINNIATALLVVAGIEYFLPNTTLTIMGITLSAVVVKTILAVLIILVLNYIAYRGADESARLMVTLAIFTFLIGILVVVPGMFQLQSAHFAAFSFKWSLILLAGFVLSETFFGWESISFMAEEIKNPERTVPRALNLTTIFVAVISLGVAIVTIGTLGVPALAAGDFAKPLIAVLENLEIAPWLILFANIGIVATFMGNAAGGIIANPRLLMALSRDKLFIEQFSDIHPKYQTPYRGIFVQTVVAILIVLLVHGAFQRLLEILVAPSIILYGAILFLVPYFRWKRPEQERPYKAPLGSFLPLLIVLIYAGLLVAWIFLDPNAILQLRILAGFMILSIPIYLLLTYFYDPDVLIKTMNKFSILNLWLEDILIPKRVRKEILELLPEANGKRMLEFGSGVGTLTVHLAEHVGKSGRIYALELSESNVKILQNRMDKLGHRHVEPIHDPHLINRVHPKIENVDIIVSIGNLSYIQDVKKVLKEMHSLLPVRGQICFVEYIDFFWFLPNPKWLSHPETIQEIFSNSGFAVSVKVRRGIFWKYLYIYGQKKSGDEPYI